MKEFNFTFAGYSSGLRPTEEVAKNTETTVDLTNLRPVVGGVTPVDKPETLVDPNTIWPFPQLFKTTRGMIIADEDELRLLNADNTTTVLITGFGAGLYWNLVDYFDFIIATNGVDVVIYNPVTSSWEVYVGVEIPVSGCMCDFNGQLLMGNIPNIWNPDVGQNWVIWSGIGKINSVLDASNVAGQMPMPWYGAVLRLKKLGQHVMVYGEDGITPIYPVSKPAVTWGLPRRNMFEFGIATVRCVVGDDAIHFFLDTSGGLWSVTDENAIKKYDYSEYFSPMLDTDICMSYDPVRKEVWICNQSIGYILTQHGLGGPLSVNVTDIIYDDSRSGLIVGIPTVYTYEDPVAVTEVRDLGTREIKNTGWIEPTVSKGSEVDVSVYSKYDKSTDVFTQSSWISTNTEGAAFIRQSGTDHKIAVRLREFDNKSVLSKLTYGVQLSDRRFTRGAKGGFGEKL